ncbi:MAG: FtsX-like permease family protein [Candidatus Heimdallarchaeota archaeon]|nr:FtsX-like permease family protein [Candidatus Heimdallarchaeota archaeon]
MKRLKRPKFFSFIGFAFRSMISNKRRSISIGAGMILGAAIFSSIFFYGSIINSITVQDMIDNVEAEVTFRPTDTDIGYTPAEVVDLILQEEEFQDSVVVYGRHAHYDKNDYWNMYYSYLLPDFNFSTQIGWDLGRPLYDPMIVDSEFENNSIIERINIIAGENNLDDNGILLSSNQYKNLGIQINDTLQFTFFLNKTVFNGISYDDVGVITHSMNLTVRGFFNPGLLLDEQHMVIGSDSFNSTIIGNLTAFNMYHLPTKLDLTKFPLSNLIKFNEYITIVLKRMEQKIPLEGRNLISGVLFAYQGLIIIMQIIDAVLYIPAIVLSMILINLGAELAIRERKFEISVLKAQGASPKQIRMMIYLEVFLIAIVGEAIGIFLGTFGAATVLSTYSFMAIDFSTLSFAYSALNIEAWSVITTAVVTLFILFMATRKKTNAFIQQEVALATTVEKEKVSWFKKIYGDVIFFVIGLVGVAFTIVEDIDPNVAFGFTVELLQAFTPILLWFGAAKIVSRLSTKIPVRLDKLLVKIFKDIGVLLKGSLSRRHQNFPRMTVLLCLSVSLCVFGAIQGETGSAEIVRHADFYIGGDMRVDILAGSNDLSISDFVGYEDKIEVVIPIYMTVLYIGATPVICFGTNLTTYGNQALWHTDSIVEYTDWNEGLQTLKDNPLVNVGVGVDTSRYLEIGDDSTFNFTTYDGSQYEAQATLTIDHAPCEIMDYSFGAMGGIFDFIETDIFYTMLVDQDFIFAYAPFTFEVTKAIINFKPEVDPVEENLSSQFNSEFEWIVYAQTHEEEIELIKDQEGRRFGFPGLLTINFLISLLAIIIGVSLFMFMIINQRKKEFAILISEGASQKQLIKLVLTEVISMAILATLFGTFIGFILGYQFNGFFDNFSITSFNRQIVYPPFILLATVLGSFVIILMSTLVPAIIASRTNVVEEMRTF